MEQTSKPASIRETSPVKDDEEQYPEKKVVIPAMIAAYLVIFLVALDRTILGTAIPRITDEFNSFSDISWYEAAFLLPLCVFALSLGRVYTFYSTKWFLTTLIVIFEVGNIVAATATSSNAVIVGRFIAGMGSAGIFSGVLVFINTLVPISKRPKYSGGLGAMFGLSSILGPLLGGYLTAITWRWVFWINLPIGGAALIIFVLFAPNRKPPDLVAKDWKGKILQLDPLGFILLAPAIVCLLFALQWGGIQYPWNSGHIIALLVLAGVLGIAFICSQIWGSSVTIPGEIVRQRSVRTAMVQVTGMSSCLIIYAIYLPVWFQAIKGDNPQNSGLSLLALLLSTVVSVISSGVGTSAIGYYVPFGIIGGALLLTGAALITTWRVDTPTGVWIGYQIVLGAGQGLTLQMPNFAVQTVLPKEQAPAGFAVIQFIQSLSGTIFVTVCQTLLQNALVSKLAPLGIDGASIANAGATSLRQVVPAQQLPEVLEIYNDSLRSIWYVGVALGALTFLAGFGFEWKNVKKVEQDMQLAKQNKDTTGEKV